jgi:hypothetical protein
MSKVCKRGHSREPHLVRCPVCILIRERARDRSEYSKSRYSRTKERQIQYAKAYNKANPDKHRQHSLTWQKKHPGKANANHAKYKADKVAATPSWADLNAIKQFYQACPKGFEVDHIVPLRGKEVRGFHVEYNLQYLTKSENSRKGNRVKAG